MGFIILSYICMATITCLLAMTVEASLSYNTSLLDNLTPSSSRNSTCLSGNETFSCPAWAYCNETAGICECYKQSETLVCGPSGKINLILLCYCLTYNEAEDVAELGPCPYNCDYVKRAEYESNITYGKIPNNIHYLNSAMCKAYNRTGTLCGECLNNTFIRSYSYDMSCSNCDDILYSRLKYIAAAFLPLTLFCLVVIVCQINIPSSQILGFVFFSQILTSPTFARTILLYLHTKSKHSAVKIFGQFTGTFYGIWNLDFFRFFDLNICLKNNSLTTISLDFFIAIYPLVIIAFIYIIILLHDSNWKIVVTIVKPLKVCFAKFNSPENMGTSLINAFATFLFLSNVKFLNVCLDLLLPVQVCSIAVNGSI